MNRDVRQPPLKKAITVAVIVSALSFSGCAGAPHKADLEMFNLVVEGNATYKQRLLWLRRTSYPELVRKGAYYLLWREGEVDAMREAGERRSVKEAIAEVTGKEEGSARSYYLVRGIGMNERVFTGDIEESEAPFLAVLPGDLLVVHRSSL